MNCVQISFYNCTNYKLVVEITFSIIWLLCIQQPFVGPYKHLLKNVPLKYVEKGAFQIFLHYTKMCIKETNLCNYVKWVIYFHEVKRHAHAFEKNALAADVPSLFNICTMLHVLYTNNQTKDRMAILITTFLFTQWVCSSAVCLPPCRST